MATTTLIQSFTPTFLWKNRPRMGTMTMYMAVMKPALPTVVYCIPTCCKQEATPRARPQHRPPMSSVLRLARSSAFRSALLKRPKNRRTGMSATPPTKDRMALKAKGPRWSIPTAWATKPVPQIMEARSSRQRFFAGKCFIGFASLSCFVSNFSRYFFAMISVCDL